jgi:hypothetical protein
MSATLYLLPAPGHIGATDHSALSRLALGRRLASFLGLAFGGEHDPGAPPPAGPRYFIPADTLLAGTAQALGIHAAHDLFGGVVPHAFLTTKTITHPVVGPEARVPEGWSRELWRYMGDAVLPGYSAFAPDDVREAGRRLLRRGPVRLKLANGIGGSGQSTADDGDQLDAAIAARDPRQVHRHGVVVELNLEAPVTYSIGRLAVGEWSLAYHGTQQTTTDHRGRQVYAGSDLHVVRGGFDALLALDLSPSQRLAVEYAMRYDDAVGRAYPGFFASRRNYDVAAGTDGDGTGHCGVLEQSWRIGGASPAEIAALEAFAREPSLRRVRASCHERYTDDPPPPGACEHYRGDDGRTGMLCKYSLVTERHSA